MKKAGYDEKLATGSIAGSACLGMLIPPSVLLIVWGIITEDSIGKLFVAGVIPGLILALMYAFYNYIKAVRNPELAPEPDSIGDITKLTSKQIISGMSILGLNCCCFRRNMGRNFYTYRSSWHGSARKLWYCTI